jgi:hypothetical protein
MKKVTSIEQLQQCIASVRNYRKGFITNFFPDPFRHSLWIEKGELSFGETGESLFLLRENSFFYSLFYVSTTLEALKSDLALFLVKHQGETLVADVVGNQDNVTARQVFLDLGFQQYASLTRMSRINNSPETVYEKNPRIVNGNVADAGVVNHIRHIRVWNVYQQGRFVRVVSVVPIVGKNNAVSLSALQHPLPKPPIKRILALILQSI